MKYKYSVKIDLTEYKKYLQENAVSEDKIVEWIKELIHKSFLHVLISEISIPDKIFNKDVLEIDFMYIPSPDRTFKNMTPSEIYENIFGEKVNFSEDIKSNVFYQDRSNVFYQDSIGFFTDNIDMNFFSNIEKYIIKKQYSHKEKHLFKKMLSSLVENHVQVIIDNLMDVDEKKLRPEESSEKDKPNKECSHTPSSSCTYEYHTGPYSKDNKFNVSCVISGTTREDIIADVFSKTAAKIILEGNVDDLLFMIKHFDLKEGYHIFNLYGSDIFSFYYSTL